ncbi:hypothetical protein BGZ97_000305 [Linnemannia gamsii]|uniref:Uncharacterized protein n=1 Tax=Linnemannia gamsii TaxID=64522 RepID=A0A9P6RHA8_9FUNG|nr:hypothetical protein BGZ97_000305 [Linnemannia gamsii]
MDKESIDINKYWPQENPPPRLLEFLQGVEFAHQCGLDRMLPTYYGRYAKERHLQQFYRVMLFREATWTLAEPILEQLQSLTIPVSAIDRFLGVVARLERLERIRFLLDALFDYRASYVWTAALEELMFPIDDLKNQTMHKMIQFVKEHAMLFPGQLVGGVSYVDGDFWVDAPQSCPRDIQLDVARWLPPLKDVSIVTDENWLRLEAHITSMDLGQVESIINRNSGRNAAMSLGLSIDDGDERPFLQRCRSLKLLEVVADGTVGRFKWAVEEKRRTLGRPVIGLDTSTGISECARTSSPQSAVSPQLQLSHQQHLIPLAKFTLTERFERIKDEVDDITFAFSQTLTHLNISSKDYTRAAITQFGFGRVGLPVLTHLTLSTDRRIAVIDEQFLLRCPSLKSVTFADKTFYYQLEEIVTSAPGSLPQLEHLDLMGMNALKFHPTTLDSTPNLVSLRVGIVPMHDLDNNDFFIPTVEQLNRSFGIQNEDDSSNSNPTISHSNNADTDMAGAKPGRNVRPQWYWDWEFLHLRRLHLIGEFAFLFEFRMLQACPALETLALEIQTSNHRYRAITPLDLRPAPRVPSRITSPTRPSMPI